MTQNERIELLENAQDKLASAIDLIEIALRGTEHRDHAKAYIIPHLKSWLYGENTINMGIQQYIDVLENTEEN